MRKVCLLVLLAFGLKGFTQAETGVNSSVNSGPEVPFGSVTGNVTTTDHKPPPMSVLSSKARTNIQSLMKMGISLLRILRKVSILLKFQW